MPTLIFARALMGASLAFHIVYTAIGIGLPLMLFVLEGISLIRRDDQFHQLARRWIRPASLLFAIGAVSGTILSFELGFLWPRFMGFAGGAIGFPFFLEGFAFFTEAIFLGLYLYGERRLPHWGLFAVTIPMMISAAASAVFVISANSWMNTPAGFTASGFSLTSVNPLQAMANPAFAHEALHGTLSSYAATSVALIGIYAVALLRKQITPTNRLAIRVSLWTALFAVPLMFLSGDYAARMVANTELPKFAAMESLFHTTQGAPLTIGGWPDPATQTVKYGIPIPKLLSFLGYFNFNATVKGLDAFPPGTTPDPRLVHPFFDLMVGSFFLMLIPPFWYLLRLLLKRPGLENRLFLWICVLVSPFGFIALESGWFVTEFGRQPWIATNYMRVAEGVTPRSGIEWIFLVFLLVYFALTIGLLWLLVRGSVQPPDADYTKNPLTPEASHERG